jgi:hypothetical protein
MKGWQKGTAKQKGFRHTCELPGLAFTEQQYQLGVQEAAMREGEMKSHA